MTESVPRVDEPVPRVIAALPTPITAVPRVPTTMTTTPCEVPASQPASNIPHYISQDDDTRYEVHQHSYNTRLNRSVQQVMAAEDLSVEIAMMATESAPPRINNNLQTGISWFGEMANSVIDDDGKILEYRHLIANPKTRKIWQQAFGNELGRLAQEMPGRVEGTNTIFFIRKSDIPADRRLKA